MIAFPGMLMTFAAAEGMKVPPQEEVEEGTWDENEFVHWTVYTKYQCARPLPYPSAHESNARVIAGMPEDVVRKATIKDLQDAGCV